MTRHGFSHMYIRTLNLSLQDLSSKEASSTAVTMYFKLLTLSTTLFLVNHFFAAYGVSGQAFHGEPTKDCREYAERR